MDLRYESLEVPRSGGQTRTLYTAAANSPSDEKLRLLLSWDSTPQRLGVDTDVDAQPPHQL